MKHKDMEKKQIATFAAGAAVGGLCILVLSRPARRKAIKKAVSKVEYDISKKALKDCIDAYQNGFVDGCVKAMSQLKQTV